MHGFTFGQSEKQGPPTRSDSSFRWDYRIRTLDNGGGVACVPSCLFICRFIIIISLASLSSPYVLFFFCLSPFISVHFDSLWLLL
ncbi:hypothetical protein JB92DRAFT_2995212 [Gautieria morchelliformis]|nr:hypothetical protein JB92DRAFT_2995212 [Gautieria morchelliformis]